MPRISEERLALCGLAVFAVWLFGILPFLYGPTPRFHETSRPQQSHSAPSKQQSAHEPRGTAEAPFFVQVIPTPKTAEEAAEERDERDAKAANDWWLTAWTGILALVTSILVVIAGVQAWFFLRQLRYMGKGMGDATIAARASARSARATVAQAKIARDTLTKVQRPYVFVFDAYRITPRQTIKDIELLPNVRYKVANFGQTPAIIDGVGVEFFDRDDGVVPAPVAVEKEHPLLTIIPAGDVRNEAQILPDRLDGKDRIIDIAETEDFEYGTVSVSPPDEVYLRIIIYYRGPFSDGHKTSACWRFERTTGQFVQHGGKEYNYTE